MVISPSCLNDHLCLLAHDNAVHPAAGAPTPVTVVQLVVLEPPTRLAAPLSEHRVAVVRVNIDDILVWRGLLS